MKFVDFYRPLRKALGQIRQGARNARGLRAVTEFINSQTDFGDITVYDIGARWGISPPYDQLKVLQRLRSVGFEADTMEAEKLKAERRFSHVCPDALGARTEKRTLHIGRDPGSSSLFRPNAREIERHTTWTGFETVKEVPLSVNPLDDVALRHQLPAPDYLKVDCEGAEGEIFQGATKTLAALCGVTFEARFIDLYDGGATLAQLTDQMFGKGFICLRLDPVGSFFGSIVMFDVVMMRHPESIDSRRQFILCLLFCFLHNNWHYAQRLADLKAKEFGCEGLARKIFGS